MCSENKFTKIKEQHNQRVMLTYGRVDVAIESGSGSTAVDVQGKEYIDFTSGIGVNCLGYSHPRWVKAVADQAAKLQHISNFYYSPVATSLAEQLCKATGLYNLFYANSGCEANECAIKVARKHGVSKGANKIITLIDSFHGRTITTLAANGQEVFHKDFLPLTKGFDYCKAGDIDALKAMVDSTVCAIMVECVQGEGGVIPMTNEYLQAVRKLCDDKDVLMITDEVQTGMGRTGSLFAFQQANILPDVMTCAKGLGGGLPIGVCMVSEKLKDILVPGNHGSTFGSNPVVCAGALAVLEEVNTKEFLDSVCVKGKYFTEKLLAMPQVENVRGKGLMLGIKAKKGASREILEACAKNGLLVLTAKDLVRFLPPLNISYQDIDKGLAIFEHVLKGL